MEKASTVAAAQKATTTAQAYPPKEGLPTGKVGDRKDRTGNEQEEDKGVINNKGTSVEKGGLNSPDGRLGLELGRRRNDKRDSLEDRSTRRHDDSAAGRGVPIAPVLYKYQLGCL